MNDRIAGGFSISRLAFLRFLTPFGVFFQWPNDPDPTALDWGDLLFTLQGKGIGDRPGERIHPGLSRIALEGPACRETGDEKLPFDCFPP
jgi:hypothetical protein